MAQCPAQRYASLYAAIFKDGDELCWSRGRPRVSGNQRSCRGSHGFRPADCSGRIHLGLTGSAPDGNAILIPKHAADRAMECGRLHWLRRLRGDVSERVGVAIMGAKIAHLGTLPARSAERESRVLAMGGASERRNVRKLRQYRECEAVCPKGIKLDVIGQMNRDFIRASWRR